MDWSWLLGNYRDQIVASGKQPVLLLMIGLVGSFGLIRTSTRMIRAQVRWGPGNVSAGGVHLYHEFVGAADAGLGGCRLGGDHGPSVA